MSSSGVSLGVQTGSVVEFDDPRGLGAVRAASGADYPFHCTAVADGTRTIAVGTAVSFRVVAGRLGRWEATEIRPATS
jgi:cold shock CspA family protein